MASSWVLCGLPVCAGLSGGVLVFFLNVYSRLMSMAVVIVGIPADLFQRAKWKVIGEHR